MSSSRLITRAVFYFSPFFLLIDFPKIKRRLIPGSVPRDASRKRKSSTKTIQQKRNNMNKDASEFSFAKAEKIIKSQTKHLPFKRLRNYTKHIGVTEKVNDIDYHLDLWGSKTRLPSNLELDWKAYAIPIRPVHFSPSDGSKPHRIEYNQVIILCPIDETILWAFQHTIFIPRKSMKTCFQGSSEIWQVDDENFRGIARDPQGLSQIFWGGMLDWVKKAIDNREKSLASLETLHKQCEQAIVQA